MRRRLPSPARRCAIAWVGAALLLTGCTAGNDPAPVVSASGPVPAPSGGEISQTVAPARQPSPIATDLNGRATPEAGVEVRLDKVESIETKAQAPGEISGPGVAITVTVSNSSGQDVDPSGLEIAMTDGKGRPGSGMTGAPAKWLSARIPSGAEASGIYVFATRGAPRNPITVSVAVSPGAPKVNFTGRI